MVFDSVGQRDPIVYLRTDEEQWMYGVFFMFMSEKKDNSIRIAVYEDPKEATKCWAVASGGAAQRPKTQTHTVSRGGAAPPLLPVGLQRVAFYVGESVLCKGGITTQAFKDALGPTVEGYSLVGARAPWRRVLWTWGL